MPSSSTSSSSSHFISNSNTYVDFIPSFEKDSIRFFECPICHRTSERKGEIARHLKTHTKEKPFKCLHPSCDMYFSRKDNMMQHYRCHNSGGYIARREERIKKYQNLNIHISVSKSPSSTCESSSNSASSPTSTPLGVFRQVEKYFPLTTQHKSPLVDASPSSSPSSSSKNLPSIYSLIDASTILSQNQSQTPLVQERPSLPSIRALFPTQF
jgi:hypothetical protein